MKKATVLVSLILAFLLSLSGCDGSSALITIKDGAYNWTPQDLIAAINKSIEDSGDSRYLTIPDYVASGEEIELDTGLISSLSLIFYTNDEGMTTKIEINRDTFNETSEAYKTYFFIVGALIDAISPDEEFDRVIDILDIDAPNETEYTTTVESNGTRYTYEYRLQGMYQYLTIEPDAE